jgi:putative colanic acid biosynthesis UDP-glucose lipid carrier transferase
MRPWRKEPMMTDRTDRAAPWAGALPPTGCRLDHPCHWLAKRCFDILVAATALLVLAPLMAVIAAAIRRDTPGPALFRQRREGYRRSRFNILKFRTMVDRRQPLFVQARRNDPRVTRLGAYLRAASLDELPQLLNVLRGELSMVGPRPHMPELSAQFASRIEGYYERLEAPPGMTGLAQIAGLRGQTETLALMAERVKFDKLYVRTWSFRGDLTICLKTLLMPLGHDRAY